MRKKIVLIFISIVSMFSVIHTVNQNLKATSSLPAAGFTIGAATWDLFYPSSLADTESQYLWYKTIAFVAPTGADVDNQLVVYNGLYHGKMMDTPDKYNCQNGIDMRKKYAPTFDSFSLFSLEEYKLLTRNEKNMDAAKAIDGIWIGDLSSDGNHYKLVTNGDDSGVLVSGYKNIVDYGNATATTVGNDYYIARVENPNYIAPIPLSGLTFTTKPQAGASEPGIFEFTKNVNAATKVGEITSENGIKPITYTLINDPSYAGDPTHANDGDKFVLKTNTDGSVDVKIGNTDLSAGTYHFKIQAQDKYGEPITPLEVNADIIVYPNSTQVKYTQLLNDNGTPDDTTDDMYYSKSDIEEGNYLLGEIDFTNDANLQQLINSGYIINNVKILKKGTTTEVLDLQTTKGSNNVYNIVKKGDYSAVTKEFDILVTFKNNATGIDTAAIRKTGNKFVLSPDLKFVDTNKNEFLLGNEMNINFDSITATKNSFSIIATDGELANSINTKIDYCVLDENKVACDSTAKKNEVIELTSANGVGSAVAIAPGTTNKVTYVRAWLKDTNGTTLSKKDIKITILPTKQELTWVGTNIQSKGNSITKDSTNQQTWNLNLKYDSENADNNKINISTLQHEGILADKNISLKTNINAETTPSIIYKISCLNPDDNGKVVYNNGVLEIKGSLKDKVILTATGEAVGNYGATLDDDTTTAGVNEYSHAKLVLSINDKPKVDYTAAAESVLASDESALGTAKLGTLKFDPITTTGYTFEIESVKKLDEKNSTPDNPVYISLDKSAFTVKNTIELYSTIALSKGTYEVKVKATIKTTGEEAIAKVISIVVKNSELDVTGIKWQNKVNKTDATFVDVNGNIDKDSKTNTETLSNTYKKDDFFYVKLDNAVGKTILDSDTTITYALKAGSTTGLISVGSDGKVSILGASKTDSTLHVEATVKKDGVDDTKVYIPIKIDKADAEMIFTNKVGSTGAYNLLNPTDNTKYETQSFVYEPNKVLDIFTKDAPTGSDVTITISYSGTHDKNDVLKFNDSDTTVNADSDKVKVCVIGKDEYVTQRTNKCQAEIQNALKDQVKDKGKVKITASVTETDNYKAMTIEMPINITKGENSDFDFIEPEIWVESNADGAFDPILQEKDQDHVNIGTGDIMLLLAKDGGSPDFSSDEVWLNDEILVDSGYVDGIKGYKYNIVIPADGEEKTFHVYALKQADRNLNESAEKQLTVHVMQEGKSRFTVSVDSYDKVGGTASKSITYGDEYFIVKPKSPDDAAETTPPTYDCSVDDNFASYVENYGTNDNEFKPLKAGENIKINVTRTTSDGTETKSSVTIRIKPKTIKLKVDDVKKKSGMSVKETDYKFTTTSQDFLAIDKDKIDIKFTAQDESATEIIDLPDGIRMKHNDLAIKAIITDKDPNVKVLSNYILEYETKTTKGVEPGKLIVTEDKSLASWYEVKEAIDTIKGNDSWFNGNVDVLLKTAAGSYDRISKDAEIRNENKFTITTEGKNEVAIYFRQSDKGKDVGAITEKTTTEIKIDTTKPSITKVTGTKVNDNGIAKFVNSITFGAFFKPGIEVIMESEDKNANTAIETSGVNSISYKAYVLHGEKFELLDEGNATMSGSKGKVVLADPGVYRVCAIAKDNAGNKSAEYCSELNVKKLEVDVDDDDIKDFIDSNNDGCPDINIVWKNEDETWTKLNVDRNKDGIPDLNIDSIGDGKADINIDSDQDGKPDTNLLNITKEMWEPTFCVKNQKDEFCTTQNLKATINVDINKDGKADINIDNNGDMKADVNIAKDGSTTPTINLLLDKNIVWKPETDFTSGGFVYDTMKNLKPEVNIDSNGDGLPDINVDNNGDGKPNINIDTDNDGIPDINIDGNGNGEADYNIDSNGDGKGDDNNIDLDEWSPNIKGDDFGTMDIITKDELEDSGIKVEKPGGVFLARFAIKVDDITKTIKSEQKEAIKKVIQNDQEIKQIYNLSYMKDNTTIQPDGSLKIKIPLVNGLKNPKLVITQKDGSQKIIEAVEENGYYVYESDYLGMVSVIGEKVETPVDPTPEQPKPIEPTPEQPKPIEPKPEEPKLVKPEVPTVKGEYTNSGKGGASTGDTSQLSMMLLMCLLSGGIIATIVKKRKY